MCVCGSDLPALIKIILMPPTIHTHTHTKRVANILYTIFYNTHKLRIDLQKMFDVVLVCVNLFRD